MVRRRTRAKAPRSAQRRNSDYAAGVSQDDQKLVAEIVRGLGLEPHSIVKTHGEAPGGLMESLLSCLSASGVQGEVPARTGFRVELLCSFAD